jgi:hypothetical protein
MNNFSGQILLRSSDQRAIFPNNQPYSFVNQLPSQLSFGRRSRLSLLMLDLSMDFKSNPKFNDVRTIYVCLDIVEDSIIGNGRLKLLRVIPIGAGTTDVRKTVTFAYPIKIPLSKYQFSKIEVKITNEQGMILEPNIQPVTSDIKSSLLISIT